MKKRELAVITDMDEIIKNYCMFDDDDKQWLARNPNLPLSLFKVMADEKNPKVRYWLANNWKLPLNILDKLSYDREESVRYAITKHKMTSFKQLVELSKDTKEMVKISAISRINSL